MKKLGTALVALVLIAAIGCKNEKKKTESESESETEVVIEEAMSEVEEIKKVSFSLESKSGSTATGKVVFSEKDGVVSMNANLSGLTPGMHAIHIHDNADCSSEDGKSAGGHWNPTFKDHGKWGVETGYHKGDIGNFEADAEGNGFVSMNTSEWCIGCKDPNKNILGKSIIVHAGVDDFTTQPTGAAGGRVSCGGIIE